jgi:hypothetical protein
MITHDFFKRIVTFIGVASMVLSVGLVMSRTVSAGTASSNGAAKYQERYQDRDRDRDRFDREDVMRIARENGYRDGLRMGEEDREIGRRFDADNNIMFRRADSGYRWEYGFRDLYRRMYRDAFIRGYEDGFHGR